MHSTFYSSQIDAAEVMLNNFITMLPELYGDRSCTANAHLLIHLPKYVRLWGPLWTHSAFGFESYNGQLKYLFHSRAKIVDQLAFNLDVQPVLQLTHFVTEMDEVAGELDINGNIPKKDMQQIDDHTYILGKPMQKQISEAESELLQELFQH